MKKGCTRIMGMQGVWCRLLLMLGAIVACLFLFTHPAWAEDTGAEQPAEEVTATEPDTTEEQTVETPVAPGKPVLEIDTNCSKVYLTWEKVKGADGYYVYRAKGDGEFKKIADVTETSYTDKKAKVSCVYYYKVAAYDKAGDQIAKGKACKKQRVVPSSINPKKKMIALTFDDGPGQYTKKIVKCLKKYGAHATFFVVGNRVDDYPEAVQAAYDAGCEIGNHSYDHAKLSALSVKGVTSEFKKTNKAVKSVIGVYPTVARAPYGAINSTVRKKCNLPLIQWSVDTLDWKTRSTSATISSVLNNARDGDIVLMHDIHQPTQKAALALIPKLVEEGYQLVTVSELAEYQGYTMKDGTTYFKFK